MEGGVPRFNAAMATLLPESCEDVLAKCSWTQVSLPNNVAHGVVVQQHHVFVFHWFYVVFLLCVCVRFEQRSCIGVCVCVFSFWSEHLTLWLGEF